LFENYGFGTTVWSPLAGGFLTGRYNKEVPEGSRLDSFDYPFILKLKDDLPKMRAKLVRLGEIAESIGGT